MKSKNLLIMGLFIAANCGVISCSTSATNYKLNDAHLDCDESANYYSRECILENPSRGIISFSQHKADLAKLAKSSNNAQIVTTNISKSSSDSSVPKPFAAVVDLLNQNIPSNEPPPAITCHYSKVQQKAFASWQTKYPQLKSISTTCQTTVIDKLRTSESISQLIGPINNPYGVRDDILEQIVKMVPESNSQMFQAAIKWAYYDNLGYYAESDTEKLKFIRKAGFAMYCTSYMDNSNNSYNKLFDEVHTKKYDTAQRTNYRNHVDATVFGWQVFTLPDKDICNEGRY